MICDLQVVSYSLPITLDVDRAFSKKVSVGEKIILREKKVSSS